MNFNWIQCIAGVDTVYRDTVHRGVTPRREPEKDNGGRSKKKIETEKLKRSKRIACLRTKTAMAGLGSIGLQRNRLANARGPASPQTTLLKPCPYSGNNKILFVTAFLHFAGLCCSIEAGKQERKLNSMPERIRKSSLLSQFTLTFFHCIIDLFLIQLDSFAGVQIDALRWFLVNLCENYAPSLKIMCMSLLIVQAH